MLSDIELDIYISKNGTFINYKNYYWFRSLGRTLRNLAKLRYNKNYSYLF